MTFELLEEFENLENPGRHLRGINNECFRLVKHDEPRIKTFRWWMIVLLCCSVIIILVLTFVKWGLPFASEKVLYPFMKWEVSTFSHPVVAIELVASLALFPVFLIPSGPSMWLAGMTFDYGIGFVIIMAGTTLGIILTYLTGLLYHELLHEWLKRWPQIAAMIRVATEGSWWQQCLMVALVRVSPFPYTLFNHSVSVTNIRFWPYLLGSVAGMIPDGFNYITSGRLMRSLADAEYSKDHKMTGAIVYNIVTYVVATVITVVFAVYVVRILNKVKKEKDSDEEAEVVTASENASFVMEKLSLERPKQLLLSPLTFMSHDTLNINKYICKSSV